MLVCYCHHGFVLQACKTYCGIVRISQLSTIHNDIITRLKLESAHMDFCGDFVNACLPHIISLLYKALGQRVTLIAAKPLPNATVIFWLLLMVYA